MIGYDFRLEQKQKLIMTPELRQAIQLLQFSSLELAEYVNQVMLENPLLESKEGENEEIDSPKDTEANIKESELPEDPPGVPGEKEGIDWQEYLRESRRDELFSRHLPREEQDDFSLENIIPEETSLQQYLLFQLGCLHLNEREQEIGAYLIGNLDSAGYLGVSTAEIAHDLGVEEKLVEWVLHFIQSFDPPGIGARSLQECLLIQLAQKGLDDEDLRKLVATYLPELGQGKINKVAAALNLPVSRVQELADIIKQLDPKPGAAFSSGEKIRYIVPDVVIERVANEFVILVNDSLVPRLTINQTYSTILNRSGQLHVDQVTKNFVENKMNQALWLIRSIEQRRRTIYRVTEALLKKQKAFFQKGIRYLQPLTMREVAEEIGLHESTVSRAVSQKYVQTPHGIFEYKFFFTTGFSTANGDSASAESIKRLLTDLLKEEDPRKPYSDQKLAEMLQKQGIKIARRTVSKYREELGVLSAAQRRRY